MLKFVKGLIQLMRPAEWTKSLANMAIAVVFAGIMYGISFNATLFLTGTASVCLLWSGLYALNDYTDRVEDALHQLKRHRPIPSGKVPARFALLFSLTLVFISFVLAIFTSHLLAACMSVMLINHLLYTMKPFNFKKRPIVDLISGSLVNPTFRFYSGWVLFMPKFNAPLLALMLILGLQFGGYGLYRMMSRGFEQKRGYRSSVALFGNRLRYLFYASIALGIFAYFFACINSILKVPAIGFLPVRYLWLVVLSLPLLPLYKKIMKNPQQISTTGSYKFIYRLLYVHTLLFFVGFFLFYILF